jgi:hypothetical protein
VKPGRNDSCPCGSGKKFKKCHLGISPIPDHAPPAQDTNAQTPTSDGALVRFAGQLAVPRLYHYRDFDLNSGDDHAARLLDILQKHRIWCSNPANFNDPWDCKPYFDPALLENPESCRAAAEALISTRTGGPKYNQVDQRLRTDPEFEFLKLMIAGFSEQFTNFITSRWGVYCLSADPCLTLMWSHHARDHKGICLEFSATNNKFSMATQVQYQKNYPRFLLHDPNSHNIMLIVKSDDWWYEQEFRLICPRFTDVRAAPLIMDGNYLPISPNDLTSIILGCQIEDKAAEAIAEMVRCHAPHVNMRRAHRAPNKYRLMIDGPVPPEKVAPLSQE